MLQFVYSLQDLYSEGALVHLRERHWRDHRGLFEESEIHQAIDQAIRGNVINVYAHSDFGRAFRMFHREHLGGDHAAHHRSSSSATREQLQPAARVGAEGDPPAGEAAHLAQSREPHDVGFRRQRDGPLSAVLRRGRGVSAT
jgi:hypothetical protein